MARTYYDVDGYPIRSNGNSAGWAMVMVMVLCAAAFIAFLWPDLALMPGAAEQPQRAVGGQAPKDVRGTYQGGSTIAPPAQAAPTPIPGIAQSPAEAEQMYQQAIQAAAPQAQPLPLNSAGEPVISVEQQQQQALSLQLAEQEGAAAADAQLAADRAAADAAALARPPDVSYEDAKAMLHRDPCHVPRANPATCAQGLYKPTPVQ